MMEQQISSSDGGPEQQSDLHRAPDACERASLLVPYPPRPTCARYRNPWGVLHAEVGTSITDSWNSWFAPRVREGILWNLARRHHEAGGMSSSRRPKPT